jgi:hypothetical protein
MVVTQYELWDIGAMPRAGGECPLRGELVIQQVHHFRARYSQRPNHTLCLYQIVTRCSGGRNNF